MEGLEFSLRPRFATSRHPSDASGLYRFGSLLQDHAAADAHTGIASWVGLVIVGHGVDH
jgi:hypothetical protein